MRRTVFFILSLSISLSNTHGQEMAKIPSGVQKQMSSMVGSWTFQGTDGDRKFSGAETIKLTNNKTALMQEGYFDLADGKKEHYVILSGWDGTKKTVLVRGFTSDGYTWTGEWKKAKDGKWEGTASGNPATFEVKASTMRYFDSGDGTPWISNFKRASK